MDQKDQNGFEASEHGIRTSNYNTGRRLNQLERDCVLFAEQIKTLKEQHRHVDKDLDEIRASQIDVAKVINERISRVEELMTRKFDGLVTKFEGLTTKFETFASANKTLLNTILVAVLASLILIIMTRWVTP